MASTLESLLALGAIGAVILLMRNSQKQIRKAELKNRIPHDQVRATMNPIYRVMQDHYPDVFYAMLEAFEEDERRGGKYADEIMPGYTTALLRERMDFTDDPTALENLAVMAERARLLSHDPELCQDFLIEGRGLYKGFEFPAELMKRLNATVHDVLLQTATAPQQPTTLPDEERAVVVQRVLNALSEDDRQLIACGAQWGGDTPAEKAAFCRFTLEMIAEMQAMPSAEGARFYRNYWKPISD